MIKAMRNLADRIKGSRNREHLGAILVLVILLAIFYRDVIFEGKTFLMETAAPGTMPNAGPYNYDGTQPGFVANDPGAIAWQQEPFNRFISKSIKRGDFPLWNPYAGLAGTPLLADGQTGPLEPIQFLFFFIPVRFWPLSIDLQLLIRFFIAGFGCYLFARRLRLSFLASMTAAVLFMLSSYFVTFGDHAQIKVEALLPLVMYGYDRLADLDDHSGPWICSLLIGWAVIAAMPESTFFVLSLGTLWYFYKSILEGGHEGGILNKARKAIWRYLGPTLLGFLISLAYLLPFLEFLQNGTSSHAPASGLVAGSFPIWALPNLVFQVQGYLYVQVGFLALFSLAYLTLSLRFTGISFIQRFLHRILRYHFVRNVRLSPHPVDKISAGA